MTQPIPPAYYVYARRGQDVAYPVGPFDTKEAADEWVAPTTAWVEEHVDGHAGFYEWGTVKVRRAVRPGRFNERVGYSPEAGAR